MRMTRRRFLLAAGVLVAIERLHGLILAQAIAARMLRDAATSGRRFLVNLLDPAVGLLLEFPGSCVVNGGLGIPFPERRTLGQSCPGSSGLPVTDEAKGNRACRRSGERTASGTHAPRDPRGMVQAPLLEAPSERGMA
jgi:hypothetical protein